MVMGGGFVDWVRELSLQLRVWDCVLFSIRLRLVEVAA
jgi:hypothetical protein